MNEEQEMALIRAGVREVLQTLRDILDFKDDHGYRLWKQLSKQETEMVDNALGRLTFNRAFVKATQEQYDMLKEIEQ